MLQLPLPVAIVCHVQAGRALAHGISSGDRWVAAQFFGIWVRCVGSSWGSWCQKGKTMENLNLMGIYSNTTRDDNDITSRCNGVACFQTM